MTSEIRANTLKNRVGLGTVSFTNTGPVVSGIVTIVNSTAAGVTLEDNAGVGNSLKITTPTGYVSVGAGNATFAHLQTDRGIFYFNRRISVDEGIISSYDENLVLQSPMNTNRVTINKDTGLVSILNDLDVDGHTNLDNVNIAGVTSVANLSSGRVVLAGTGGKLEDSGNLTFSGSTLTATGGFYVNSTQNASLNSNQLIFDRPGYSYIDQTSDSGSLVFRVSSSSTQALRLDSSGQAHFISNVIIPDAIQHAGDLDTKIRFDTTNQISFETGGTERFRINNIGHVTVNSTSYQALTITTSENGTNGPEIQLMHNTASPAAGDVIGQLRYSGKDSAGNTELYAKIETKVDSPTSGSETGFLDFSTRGLGSYSSVFRIKRRSTASAPSYTADDMDGVILDIYNTGNPYPRYMNFIAKAAGNSESNITFWTEAVGGSPTEKLRITSGGVLTFPSAGIGLHNSNTNSYFFSQGSNETRLYHAANNQVKLAFRKNGDVYQGAVNADDNGIGFFTKSSGSSGEEWGIRCKPDSETELFYNGNARLFTTNFGISVNTNTLIAATDADDLQIGTGSGQAGMTIYSGTNSNGAIYFGDGTGGTNPYSGFLQYYHGSNSFGIGTLGGEKVLINSVGRVFHRNTTNFNREAYTKGGTVHGGGDATGKDSVNPGAFAFINETPVRGSNSRYSFWIQTGDAYPNASNFIDFTVQNAYMYRVLIKGSNSSDTADIAQFLIYGLANNDGQRPPVIEQLDTTPPSFNGDSGSFSPDFHRNSGSFSCIVKGFGTSGGTRGSTGTYDTTLRIQYSGNNNQGLIAFIERWDTGT